MAASSHGKSSGSQAKRPATPSSTEADSESEAEYTVSSDGSDAESPRPPVKKVAAKHAKRSTIFFEDLPDDKYAQAAGARMQEKQQRRRIQASDVNSSSGKGEDTPSETETDTDGGVDTPSESEEGSSLESKNGVRGRQQSASGAKSGPSKSASTAERPSRSQPLDREQATDGGQRRRSPDRDLEKGRSNGWRDDNDDGGCCGCGICGCLGCWDEVTNWRLWSWLRRRSAYMIAGLAGLGMVAAGGTGVNGQWTFISVNGYDLGGLGYCQG